MGGGSYEDVGPNPEAPPPPPPQDGGLYENVGPAAGPPPPTPPPPPPPPAPPPKGFPQKKASLERKERSEEVVPDFLLRNPPLPPVSDSRSRDSAEERSRESSKSAERGRQSRLKVTSRAHGQRSRDGSTEGGTRRSTVVNIGEQKQEGSRKIVYKILFFLCLLVWLLIAAWIILVIGYTLELKPFRTSFVSKIIP